MCSDAWMSSFFTTHTEMEMQDSSKSWRDWKVIQYASASHLNPSSSSLSSASLDSNSSYR